jgi:hypothetical protein
MNSYSRIAPLLPGKTILRHHTDVISP